MFQILFVLKIMAVILTVPITGTIDLTPMDNTDGEWVAPGYEVITELDFDPLQYVDDVQAAQAFFMDTDDGEKLRLILVGDNRVLVFDEPWNNPMEYSIEPPWEIGRVIFARNGRYLAISAYKDSIYNDGYFDWELKAYKGFRIEITEESILSEQFNSNPGEYFYFYYISNEGMIAGSNAIGVVSLYPQGDIDEFLSRDYITQMWNREGCSYDGSLIVLGNIPIGDGTIGIQGYDWSGNLLWETSIGDMVLTEGLNVSPSGEYVLAPTRNNGIICFSGANGQKLWETGDSRHCSSIQVSPDGNKWVGSLPAMYFYTGNIGNSSETTSINAFDIVSTTMNTPVCLSVSSCGNSLLWMHDTQNAKLLRMILCKSDQSIVWASGEIDILTPNMRFRFHRALNPAAIYFGSSIAATSEDGSRICYTDYESIKVLRFEEVQ